MHAVEGIVGTGRSRMHTVDVYKSSRSKPSGDLEQLNFLSVVVESVDNFSHGGVLTLMRLIGPAEQPRKTF